MSTLRAHSKGSDDSLPKSRSPRSTAGNLYEAPGRLFGRALGRPPGESRPEPLLEQRGQLTLVGEPLLLLLAEDERAVQRHLEDPFGPRLQLHPGDDRGIAVEDVGRRTDGPFQIVSGDAELDGQPVLVIQHLSLVVPEDRPTTSV